MKKLIVEGRYDSLVTTLSNKLLGIVKDSYENVDDYTGEFSGQKIYFKQGETIPNIDDDAQFKHIYFEEVENTEIPVEFYLSFKVMWIEGFNDFRYGGDAYNPTTRDSAEEDAETTSRRAALTEEADASSGYHNTNICESISSKVA